MIDRILRRTTCGMLGFIAVSLSSGAVFAAAYQDAVLALEPSYYYQLNETDPIGQIIDSTGNGPPGSVVGDYVNGAELGIPGPDFLLLEGAWNADAWDESIVGIHVPLPGLGEDNLAHASNNVGYIVLGDSDEFGAPEMSVAMFVRGGPAQGGDRIFTNNLADPTRSFQINVGNNGLVVSMDPGQDTCAGLPDEECAHRSLFFPQQGGAVGGGEGADRGLLDPENGWWHVVVSTEGNTALERAGNLHLWLNGVDRSADMKAGTDGWGIDTNLAKIGGRRLDPTDTTTHSGAQDEVAIWLGKALNDAEAMSLFNAAVNPPVDGLDCDFNNNGTCGLADIDLLLAAVGTNDAQFDLDSSGAVDTGDINAWLTSAGNENNGRPYLAGDATLDGTVDASDLNAVGINWQSTTATSWAQGDFNGDANVNAADLNSLGVNWQQSAPLAAAVPEPSGIVLVLSGFLLLIRRRQ